MIRLVTAGHLCQLEQDAEQARSRAREVQAQADAALGRHVRELHAVTDRAERAEADATEVGEFLSRTLEELFAAQQELLLKDIEIRRLRAELEGESLEGRSLTVLLHYGEPHTVYASREDAYADTATHGADPDGWVPSGERPATECRWRCEAFIYDAASNGFRRAHMPTPQPIEGAA
ncbi:hypothetical protein UK15_13570 [Streptomyces variegatus]|uniref:Uncharacterized protein n=1 Tax=Streptomyces variegatus TaxID=284040 RepID=A0A0M2GS64_9ACTN|nr:MULTISPECIES: hypothetical protein [Streptomyces]KJK38971.1 hypothetical protein UK15_13570 [Streptomyces variegatus]